MDKKTLFPFNPVLLVDDEISALKGLELVLRSSGIRNIISCEDSRDVMPLLLKNKIELILLDLTMPFMSGEELLDLITTDFPEIPTIIITGKNEVDIAVKCMKSKAFDYIVKPVEKSRLLSSVKRAIEISGLLHENQLLKDRIISGRIENPEAFSEILTNNQAMRSLFQYAESIAKSPQPVIITGETGVGKELMAGAIHRLSDRQGKIVSVNAAGIDDNVFSDTLFGHVKGAFTGADENRKGLVESAAGGTLVLDEIGDLSAESQVKLLRLLQEKEYFPIGSDMPKLSDARVIVSTNLDIDSLQESGRFRKDLYYRLSTHHLHVPPLRERVDDLPLLLGHFIREASDSLNKQVPDCPEESIALLSTYHFPGNVRELRSMVYEAVTNLKAGHLAVNAFKPYIDKKNKNVSMGHTKFESVNNSCFGAIANLPTMDQATMLLIEEAMKRTNNNKSKAAKLLGISRQRLSRHLKPIPN